MNTENDLVYRLRKRAEIRRQIPNRKSVQENQPDRIADLLEESANEIDKLRNQIMKLTLAGELDELNENEKIIKVSENFTTYGNSPNCL